MPDAPSDEDPRQLGAHFGAASIRTGERSVSTRLEVRDDLCDDHGGLRLGAVTYAVDIATGLGMGVAVLPEDLWVVTTDLDVHLTAPVTAGPLRVDVEVLRAGATTAVAAFSLHDEGTDRAVGGGTATGRPFPFEFDRALVQIPIGHEVRHDVGQVIPGGRLPTVLGFQVAEDGSIDLDVEDWLRNPWGILHGGVTACMVDIAGEVAGSAALGNPMRATGELVRFLAPGRVGPVRATPRVLAADDDQVLVEVRVVDRGAGDRVIAVGSCTGRRQPALGQRADGERGDRRP